MPLLAAVSRTRLTPPWGVELAGWGYYLGRTWGRIRDHTASARFSTHSRQWETTMAVRLEV